MLNEKGITQHVNQWVEKVDVGNVLKVTAYNIYRDGFMRSTEPKNNELPRRQGTETTEMECDSVVLVTGRTPNDKLFLDLKARKDDWAKEGILNVYRAGDCFAPRVTADVVFDGHRLAREFEEANPERHKPYIRERLVWGADLQPKFQ
jgi:dimethylamine/trimethylamine dehydrogenase